MIRLRVQVVAVVSCDKCRVDGLMQAVGPRDTYKSLGGLIRRAQGEFAPESTLPGADGKWRCAECRVPKRRYVVGEPGSSDTGTEPVANGPSG